MKKIALSLLLSAVVLAVGACQKKQTSQNQQPANQSQTQATQFPTYNSQSVDIFKGQILQIISISDPSFSEDVLGILLRTPKGDIPVQLGPSSYVQGEKVYLQPMQEVEVKGSVLYFDGQIFVIAKEISTQGYTLKLRDDNGNPLWTGWKKS